MATTPLPNLKNIDNSWTLFLDRDGVINYEKRMDYILDWNEFKFYDYAPSAIAMLSKIFSRIIVVSNQKGVGKGLMSESDLSDIHNKMQKRIVLAGGRIDQVYVCTSVDNDHPDRKPNHGMAIKAQNDFPDIDLAKSLVVGNKLSDMAFGRKAGMITVFVATTHPETPWPHRDIDFRFEDLADFVKAL